MSEVNRSPDAERRRLEQEIASLRQQITQIGQQYQQELQRLQQQSSSDILSMNNRLQEQHRQQLAQITVSYNTLTRELNQRIQEQQREINRRIEQENREIYARINRMESQIRQQIDEEKATADEYRARMHNAWSRLLAREELRPYVEPHADTLAIAENAADEAYQLRQYQAVTAIMVNSSTMIDSWEQSAQAFWDEWQRLFTLCRSVFDCLHAAYESSPSRQVDCDSRVHTVNLRRYDQSGFSRLGEICSSGQSRLDSCQSLSIEEMRMFLHELQRDQRFTDDLMQRCTHLHCAHVRRLRVLRTVEHGLRARGFERIRVQFNQQDLLQGVRALFRGLYQHDLLLITITSPRATPEETLLDVELFPSSPMDESMQYALCHRIARYASDLITQQPGPRPATQPGNAYRNENGFFQAQVEVLYHPT